MFAPGVLQESKAFRFDRSQLRKLGQELHQTYITADPYPHIVIDDFLPESVLRDVLAEFPTRGDEVWTKNYHANSKKLSCNDTTLMGPATNGLFLQFNSKEFLPFLEALTGIDKLIPDVHLEGGGYHFIERGGFLKVHADFNYHPSWRLDRRLNLLLYLNEDWKEEYGGSFELWDTRMERCVKKVLPIFNRCVVFSTTDNTYHGHPEPLNCPEDRARKSIALYYYTNGRPEGENSDSHSTLYRRTPDERRESTVNARLKNAAKALLGR